MADLTPRQIALCVAAAALVLVLGLGRIGGRGSADGAAAPPAGIEVRADAGGGGRAVVHVAGAVRRPGVYRMAAGARVEAAVRRAGGATRRADLGAVNLAAEVQDGRQVLVPRRAPGSAGVAAGVAPQPAEGQPLNLNTATLEQLDTLSGVGPATAQTILDAREERGGFGSIEELGEIPGIGDARLATLREEATV